MSELPRICYLPTVRERKQHDRMQPLIQSFMIDILADAYKISDHDLYKVWEAAQERAFQCRTSRRHVLDFFRKLRIVDKGG